MNEFEEKQFEQEITKEEFKRQILERIEDIWTRFGWQCQKEIDFIERPIKLGGLAQVQEKPKDLNNPKEKFKVLFFVGKNDKDRQEILKTIDFLVPHELAHSLSNLHKDKYDIKLSKEQFNDLNQSKNINPEHFYSGGNEIATDVSALKILEKEDRGNKMAGGIIALLESEKDLEPFYRDEARFEALFKYLENKGLMNEDEKQRAELLISDFHERRNKNLDKDDLRRFDEMKKYLQEVIQKAEKIEI